MEDGPLYEGQGESDVMDPRTRPHFAKIGSQTAKLSPAHHMSSKTPHPRHRRAARTVKSPIKDPLYRQIFEALAGKLDPDIFEPCATDILRDDWPTLAPVPGGSDGGRDGVTSDDGPFLVCTTSDDVSRNLRKSLDQHTQSGAKSRAVIVATSALVTAPQRASLERHATDRGYVLRNVYERTWFSNRLYENSRWRKELLGIAGVAPVLSAVPVGWRSGPAVLVGRDAEIARLRDERGDVVVVGQPGSGKTAVLQTLIPSGGLFVVNPDIGQIADACRELKPTAVIVDDAAILSSLTTEFLARLRHLRTGMHADFRIVAGTWPAEAKAVMEALGADETASIQIERLSRDQVVQLLGQLGITGPSQLVRWLVDQADGLAGMATALAQAVLSGKGEKVFTGEALAERTYSTLDRLLPKTARYVLGVLALGGDAGMAPSDAARLLGMSVPDYFDCVARLADGGILRETVHQYNQTHAVFPRLLRWVLVRDMFFKGPPPVSYESAIAMVPSASEATKVLIGAQSRGAYVPDLRERVLAADRKEVWTMYASMGRSETIYALENDENALENIVQPALRHAPDRILPRLLEAAVQDGRELSPHPEHPLRQIETWSEAIDPFEGDFISRRNSLLLAVESWGLRGDGARASVALQALSYALAPAVNGSESDPGGGHTLTITRGLLGVSALKRLGGFWPRALKLILAPPRVSWKPVFRLIQNWIYPSVYVQETEESEKARAGIVEKMLVDLAGATREHPGLQHRLKEIADRRSVVVDVVLSQEYEELFPRFPPKAEDLTAACATSAKKFADRHVAGDPNIFASRLVMLEIEARLADQSGPYVAHQACALIAAQVSDPLAWFRALRAAGAAPNCAERFLRHAAEKVSDETTRELAECLTDRAHSDAAIAIVLVDSRWPQDLVAHALAAAGNSSDVLKHLSMVGRLPVDHLKRLLESDDEGIRAAVIEGHWIHIERGSVAPALRDAWRSAVLRAGGRGHVLVEILQGDHSLAEDWIASRIDASTDAYIEFEDTNTMENVAAVLPNDARQRLLARMTSDAKVNSSVVDALIGDDIVAYRGLLLREEMKIHHLRLLEGEPNSRWLGRAKATLEAGHAPEDIAQASFGGVFHWTGSEYEFWQSWKKSFEDLNPGADEVCRPILAEGARLAGERAEEAKRRERREETYGRY